VQRQQIDPSPREPVDSDVDLHLGRSAHRALLHLHRRIQRLIADRHSGTALLCSAVTAAGALNAVWVTATATRDQVNRRMR
jgi:hypothetical protein